MKRIGILSLLLTLTLSGCDALGMFIPRTGDTPNVESVTPSNSATNVSVGASVVAQLTLPNGGINQVSVDSDTSVRLINTSTNATVPSDVSVDNDAAQLVLKPASSLPLDFGTTYRFEVTSAVTDASGTAFPDFSSTFTTVSADVPSVVASRPTDGETDVPANIEVIAADIKTIGGVDENSLNSSSVYLEDTSNGTRIDSEISTSGGDDTITLNPSRILRTGTTYQFNVTSAVKDLSGVSFVPYSATFTTDTNTTAPLPTDIDVISQTVAARQRHTSLAVDPSGTYLYAAGIGEIRRYPISADGSLSTPQPVTRISETDGSPRLIIGLTFDPASTASNPIIWVTHTALNGFDGKVSNNVEAFWAGKLTRFSGPNLQTAQDYVVGLPRSSKDHVTNSVAFNPAEPGVVYIVQGSNTAMGAPDSTWRWQPDRTLSGAVLRLDTNKLGSLPLNVQTEDGGNYNPYAPDAPLTIYATGTRNSFDLVWHSNGNLYVPANGSAAGGNVPRYNPIPGTCENRPDGGYTGPTITDQNALNNYVATGPAGQKADGWTINSILNDYLFKVEKGGYYGTPNPSRCEWILNGGSVGFPGEDSTKRPEYPAGTNPDPNYRGPAGDFGRNISPNGALEYKGSTFPGLANKLLVVRYSGGDDVVAVTLGSDGKATSIDPIIETPTSPKLIDPLDITESPTTGYMYVSWFNELGGQAAPQAGITLLRPK